MQCSLFDNLPSHGDSAFRSIVRTQLAELPGAPSGSAWLEYAPAWCQGQQRLLDLLLASCDWEQHRRNMYDRVVDVPRLVAGMPGSSFPNIWREGSFTTQPHRASKHTVDEAARLLRDMAAVLSHRYQRDLSNITLGYYRSGADSVAFHGDKLGSLRKDTVVAIVSVGARRRFLLRPAQGAATGLAVSSSERAVSRNENAETQSLPGTGRAETRSLSYSFGEGDLLVMGGDCQETWDHGVPKMAQSGPRIAIMFREPLPRPVIARMPSPGYQAVTNL